MLSQNRTRRVSRPLRGGFAGGYARRGRLGYGSCAYSNPQPCDITNELAFVEGQCRNRLALTESITVPLLWELEFHDFLAIEIDFEPIK